VPLAGTLHLAAGPGRSDALPLERDVLSLPAQLTTAVLLLLRFHQASVDGWMYYALLGLPLVNGLATSVALETALLARGPDGLTLRQAFKTAVGMSFISMLMMEVRHFAICPAAVLDFFRVA
jgi:hypothetical protein